MTDLKIRMATLDDAEKILNIYNPYIENTTITSEYKPLSLDAFTERMRGIMEHFPWLVCERNGEILGYTYASPYHTRDAYFWNCDVSIYIDSNYHENGIGTLLYEHLFCVMRNLGYYNIYATVTSPNPISLAFHKHLGFIEEGYHEKTGFKFGKWFDVTHLVKRIGDFSTSPTSIKSIDELSQNLEV